MNGKKWMWGLFWMSFIITVYVSKAGAASALEGDCGDYYVQIVNGEAAIWSYHGEAAEVEIPQTVTFEGADYPVTKVMSFGSYKFSNSRRKVTAENVTKVTFPEGIVEIGESAFSNLTDLREVHFPNSLKYIRKWAFMDCEIDELILPKNLKIAEACSFQRATCVYVLGKKTKVAAAFMNIISMSAPKGSPAYKEGIDMHCGVTTKRTPVLTRTKDYLCVGDTERIRLCNVSGEITYKSNHPGIVSVSKGGVIRADKPGSAMITVTGGGKDLKYQVKVYKLNMKNRVKQIRKRELKQGMNTLEKILAVHYWMSRHIAYDTNQRGSGAKILLTGGGVCADYSRGFGYMMNELKVPYAAMIGTVNGILHEWSMVKYKGKWYHIDVTFDDGGLTNGRSRTIPRLYYFMIASKLMGKDHQFDKKYVYAKKATSTKFDNKRKSSDFTRFPMD